MTNAKNRSSINVGAQQLGFKTVEPCSPCFETWISPGHFTTDVWTALESTTLHSRYARLTVELSDLGNFPSLQASG